MIKIKHMQTFFLLFFLMIITVCCAFANGKDDSNLDKYHALIKERAYYEAFLILDDVMEEIKDMDEGAPQLEVTRLLAINAGTGKHDWVKILENPKIQLNLKLYLVELIHENSTLFLPKKSN